MLADHITGKNPAAAYHGSKVATKLKVMGVEVASMGVIEPEYPGRRSRAVFRTETWNIQKADHPRRTLSGRNSAGRYQQSRLPHAGVRPQYALPEERLRLLFDIGDPPKQVTFEEMSPDTQICNCNGVSKGALIACVNAGKRSGKAVMEATRAGMGCGSCKAMVNDIVEWACGGKAEEDPSIHYYVPGVPLTKPELIRAIRERNLKSVSAVFDYLAGGKEDAASKPGLASLLKTLWHSEYEDERDARFINERVHANIQRDGTFSVVPQIPGGITNSAQLRRIADVVDKYNVPLVSSSREANESIFSGSKKKTCPRSGRISTCRRGMPMARVIARARVVSVPTSAGSAWVRVSGSR